MPEIHARCDGGADGNQARAKLHRSSRTMQRFVDREQDQLIAGKPEAAVEILADIR